MPADEMDVHKVPGLGAGVETNSNGSLVFCKSRTLCHKFYHWLIPNIIIPYIDNIKNNKNLDEDRICWFTLDGESKQIVPMMEANSHKLLKDNNIVATKPPGSTSHVTQPADVGKIFKAIKATLPTLNDSDNLDIDLKNEIVSAIETHESKIGKKFLPAQRKKAIDGLQKMQRAINIVINWDIIRQSFSETGIYNPLTKSYDIQKIIDQHRVDMSHDEGVKLIEAISKLSKVINSKGELDERDMTNAGLPATTEKDKKTWIERRTVFLTNPIVVQKEILKKHSKKPQADSSQKKRKVNTERRAQPSRPVKKLKISYDSSDTELDDSDSDYD